MFPVGKVGDSGNTGTIDTSDERKAFDLPDNKTGKETSDSKEDKEGSTEDEGEDTGDDKEGKEGDESSEESEEDIDEGEQSENSEEADEEDEEDDSELEADSLYQQIKKVAPKLLKEVPELRQVIFREQEFTQLFPSVKEAKEAKEGFEVFQSFQQDIDSGNPANLLKAIGDVNKDSLTNFSGNFLPSLEKLDKNLYLEVLYPQFKKMLRVAAKDKDERIANSASNIHYFLFGDMELDKEVGVTPKAVNPKEDELSKREREFEERQYKSFATDVSTTATGRVKRFISKAFEGSDISDLLKNKLTDEIFARVDAAVSKDARHMGNMNNLWARAKRAGFTTEWKDSIINAYLSRAKVLVPTYRQKVLSEARVSVKDRADSDGKKRPTRISGSNSGGSSGFKPGQKVDARKIDWNATDERAALDGRITLKK